MKVSELHTWAHITAQQGDKVVYAEVQPCTWPQMAHMARKLTHLGLITTTSRRTTVGREVSWEAIAVKL